MSTRALSPGRGPASPTKAAGPSLETRVADAKRAVAAKPKPQQKKKFSKNKDTIDTLKNSLDTKPKFSKMVEYSVDCLKNLAVDEVSVEEMIEEGVLDSLLRVLKLNPYNEQIQKMINDTISSFCLNERLAAMIAQKMGTAPFVHSLTKHVEPETLISTTATVNTLLKGESKEVVETFTRGGIIGALKKVVEGAKKVEVAEEAVEGLNRLAHASPASAQAVWDSGVMEPVLAYWKEHLDEPRLTKDVVGLLYNVGKNNPKAVEALKKMGAVDTLMEALELHPDNEEIAKVGVEALKLFTNQSDVGAALLVTAGNNKATAAAASKLCSLLLVPENVDYMSKHEGIPWLIAAVKAATGQEGDIAHNILKAGTRGLGRMAASEDKIYEIMKHGGVKVLVSVLTTHADDDDVASPALHALAKMLTRKPNADFILKSGGLEAAMAFLKQNPNSEQAAQAFLEFAEGLAKYPELVGSLLPLLPKIVDIINRFGSKPEIAALGMNLLGRMAVSEEAMAKIVDAGGLSAPIAVLQHHHDNAKVAKPAVMLLETATMLPTTVEPLRNLGAVKAVSQALADSPDDNELQEMGQRTLATVAGKKDLADALNELKKLPKDPSKSDGKYPAALVPPMTVVATLAADEGKNGVESRDYLIKNGGVPALLAVFDAAQRLPANDENRLKLLRGAAKALTGLAPDKAALSEMAKKNFGKVLNDEAERTGDPQLLKLAEAFQKASGGAAGGGDPDAERERQLADALDEIKNLPRDPTHADGKYPAALGEPTSLINESMDDPVTGDKSREYLGEHQAVQRLCAEWDALSKLPPTDPHKKKILKDAAEALYKLKDEPGALDHMSKVGFGKLLRDEAVKTGDRDFKRLADEFAKLPDGAGGADQDYSDPTDRKALARALEEIAKAPTTLASGKDPSKVTIPAAFLNNGLDDPSNRDWLGNNGAIKKLIDAWEAMNKLPDGAEKRKGLKNIAEALLKLAPTNGAAAEFAKRGFVKKLEDEAARMKDAELARLAEQLKKELDPVYGDKNDQKELARALKDLDDFAKDAGKGDKRAVGKIAIPAAFLNGAADDDKNREWLGNNGIKKLIDAFEALKNSKDPARRKGMKQIADLLAKMKDQDAAAKELASRKFGQMLKDEAMRMNDPELIALSKLFDPVGATTGFASPEKKSGTLQAKSPAKAGTGASPIKREDPAKYKEIARTGGPHALADLLNKNKDNDEFMQTVAPIMADMFDNASDQDLQKMMDDPACVDALMNIIRGNETLATPLSLADLAKATGAGARLKLKPATVKQMLKNNPQAALMKIIGATDDPLLLSNAAKLLGRMAGNEEAMALLSSIATIRELIDAMRRNIKNQEFLRYGAYLLGEFANIEKLKTEIGVEGGIGLLLQITGLYPKNKDLIENCCFALANCSAQHPVNCTFVVASNGINNMIGLMAAYPKAEELLENAVCVLCNIAYDARTKDAVVKAGGAQAIVDTTLNNFDAVELMVSCLRTLGVLAYNKPCSEAIIKAGGVQGIVAAMTVHNDKEDVILMALRVLTNLAAEASQESLDTLAQEGAVQAAVEASIQYGKHHELELASLGCLCNLGLSKSNASMIIKQGGTEAICDAFSIHNYEAKLAEKGCRLIHILTHSTQDLERMLEAKVGDAVLGAMKANGKNKAVLSPALTAVAGLAHGEKSAKKLAEDTPGLIPAIMALLKTNMADPQIVCDCFKALSALSRAEPNALGMAAMTMSMFNTALATHSSNTKVLEAAFKFMSNLCFHKSCSELAPGAEVVPSSLVALGIHGKDPATLIFGCKALENMAYGSNAVKDYMKSQGVLQKMKEIQTENPTRDDVRRAAQLVIDALTRIEIDIDFKPLALNTGGDKKKAKEIFHKEEKGPVVVLPKEIRNLLNAGALMMKHSKTAVPRKKHVYVDIELKRLIWKDPKEKKIDPKNTMKVGMMKEVQKGNCTPQLQRKTLMTKKETSNADCAFAIFGRDRTVDLECNSMEERDKWVNAIEILIEYKRGQKAAATVFGTVARA